MPLLEVTQSRQISASIRLDETTAAQVDQYAAFIHASADDVVDKALNYVFAKDRDFQDFLKTSQATQVVLHSPYPESADQRCCSAPIEEAQWDGRCRGGVHGNCAGIEGMNLHVNPWRGGNGATHRKHVDTPPLRGSCSGATRIREAAPTDTNTYRHGVFT